MDEPERNIAGGRIASRRLATTIATSISRPAAVYSETSTTQVMVVVRNSIAFCVVPDEKESIGGAIKLGLAARSSSSPETKRLLEGW